MDQSRKLIELGLDFKTADMCWTNHYFGNMMSSMRVEATSEEKHKSFMKSMYTDVYTEPAWSLSALIDLILETGLRYEFFKQGNLYQLKLGDIYSTCGVNEDSIDAAFELVCWIIKNKIIDYDRESKESSSN